MAAGTLPVTGKPRRSEHPLAKDLTVAELPSGTVTFLFTDIEGSTALWERDP